MKKTHNFQYIGVNFELSYVFATSEDCVQSYVSYFQSLESTKIFCLR